MIKYRKEDPLTDFRNFLTLCWYCVGLPKPTKRQYEIAFYLQYGPRRRGIKAFRGVGKSWITAAFVMFCLRNNRALNIMVVSASKPRADNFATFCFRLMQEVPELNHLMPSDDQRKSKIAFDVATAPPSQSPSVCSIGINGQITGNRADLIIPDDVEVPNNSETQLMREKLAERVKEFDAVLKPNGHIVFLGTPQNESSIYNLLPSRGYVFKVWPARYPTVEQVDKYGEQLAPGIIADLEAGATPGRTTEPDRFTDLDLAEREASYGRAGFALQFMLDTNLSDMDRYPLKLSDLIFMNLNADCGPEKVIWSASPEYIISNLPNVGLDGDRMYRPMPITFDTGATVGVMKYANFTGCVMSIDPAGRGKDETAYAVVAYLNGMLFLLDAGAFNGYGDQTLEALANIAKKWKVNEIVPEENFGDGMFTKLLQPFLNRIYPCRIGEGVKHHTQKERRIIDTVEPVMSSHKLIVNTDLVRKDYDSVGHYPTEHAFQYRLFYQLTHLTRDKGSLAHDDRVDALAIAVGYWVEHMSRDTNKAALQQRDKALDQELRRFKKHVFGVKRLPNRKHWLSA